MRLSCVLTALFRTACSWRAKRIAQSTSPPARCAGSLRLSESSPHPLFSPPQSDRPLLVQFCANDPQLLLAAARLAAPHCDGIDLNLGCPQRIAKRGNYGAFLMDDLPTVQRLVETLHAAKLCVPVTCKIRLFPDVAKTIAYAQMLEKAGCMLLAVHGRTRDQKDTEKWRADWAAIRAVRESVLLPVLANGDVRDLDEARACMEATGCCGVLSAEPLLHNPALFDPTAPSNAAAAAAHRPAEWPALLALEYCQLARQHGTPMRMVRGHMHKLLGGWLGEFTDQRDLLNNTRHGDAGLTIDGVEAICTAVAQRIREACALHRRDPVAKKGERAIAREAAEAQAIAVARAVEEQRREEGAVRALEDGRLRTVQACHTPAEAQDSGRKRSREDQHAAPCETTH